LKKYIGALFLFWAGVLFLLYYVVQKPGLLNIFAGLLDTLWTILVAAILLFNAYGLGRRILHVLRFNGSDPVDRLLLGWGMGLGTLGLLGLLFAIINHADSSRIQPIFPIYKNCHRADCSVLISANPGPTF
jgi:hypothetical protein